MHARALAPIALAAATLIVAAARPAAAGHKPPPDLTGEWRMDPDQSQPPRDGGLSQPHAGGVWTGGMPGGPGGHGGFGRGRGAHGEGEGEGAGEAGERRAGGAYGRTMLLPERVRIAQADGVVAFSDTADTELAEIVFGDVSAIDGESSPVRIRRFTGAWKGSRLEVEHSEGEDVKVTDTYRLLDKGRTLEIHTKVERGGGRPSIEFTRVYRKVGGA